MAVKKVNSDMNVTTFLRQEISYVVDRVVRSRSACNACGYRFSKSDLRIKTTFLRHMHPNIIPCQISLCIKTQCIENAQKGKFPWVRKVDMSLISFSKSSNFVELWEYPAILKKFRCLKLGLNGYSRTKHKNGFLWRFGSVCSVQFSFHKIFYRFLG